MSEDPTIQSLAAEAAEWFETATKTDGETRYTRTKDGAPEWVTDLVYAAHGDMFPDDWRYACIASACSWIAENGEDDDSHEFADAEVDTYNGERVAWLASGGRQSYVDDARENLGPSDQGIIGDLGLGQYQEAGEVYGLVYQALEEYANEDVDHRVAS